MAKKKARKSASPKGRKTRTGKSSPSPNEASSNESTQNGSKTENSGNDKVYEQPVGQSTGLKDSTPSDSSQPQTAMSQLMEVQKEKLGKQTHTGASGPSGDADPGKAKGAIKLSPRGHGQDKRGFDRGVMFDGSSGPSVPDLTSSQGGACTTPTDYLDSVKFDDSSLNSTKRSLQKIQTTGRLALTKEAARFELPMDLMLLETMTPQEYLRDYCRPTAHRKMILDKIYMRNKDGKVGKLLYLDLQKALGEFLIQTADKTHIKDVFKLLVIDKEIRCDRKLFHGIALFSERMLLPLYKKIDVGEPRRHKEQLERADFECLKWKLKGINVNVQMMALLQKL